jgi:hypothetical protein
MLLVAGLSLSPAVASAPPAEKVVELSDCFLTANYNPSICNIIATESVLNGKDDIYPYLDCKYPEMADLLKELIDCESGFDSSKCGDSGLSCGILQIQEQTFKDWNCKGEWKNSEDQIDCSVPKIKEGIGSTTEGWYNCWRIKNLFKYGY